jgi:hypothetical protein
MVELYAVEGTTHAPGFREMDMKRVERRRSSSSIDALRRELRDADRERFYLQAAVNNAAEQWLSAKPRRPVARRPTVVAIVASTVGVCLLLLGGIVWKRLATPPPSGEGRPVTVASELLDSRLVDRTDNPARQTIAVRSRPAVTAAPKKGASRSGPRPVSAGRSPTTQPGAIVPRPLSPGEFGRSPSR